MLLSLKHVYLFLLTLVIVVGIGMPHICVEDQATHKSSVSSVSHSQHDHSKTSKAADHCCVAHHCCAGKFLGMINDVPVMKIATSLVFTVKDQIYSNFNVSGVDRPPKSIA